MSAILENTVSPHKHLISIEEFYNSWKAGFVPDRAELINGVIYEMAPIGSKHLVIVGLLGKRLNHLLPEELSISTQWPIKINAISEPEPDICVLNKPLMHFFENIPNAQDVELIIEVADSTLQYDCGKKAQLYAENGIQRYWVIDVNNMQFIIHEQPDHNGYQEINTQNISTDTLALVKEGLLLKIGF